MVDVGGSVRGQVGQDDIMGSDDISAQWILFNNPFPFDMLRRYARKPSHHVHRGAVVFITPDFS